MATDLSTEAQRAKVEGTDVRKGLLSSRLLQLGILLFIFGLLTGLAVPLTANPRMALSSHLEALMNGMFLIGLGLLWPRLVLSHRAQEIAFWLAVYAAFANWLAVLLAAMWGAGNQMMPLAAQGRSGSMTQETVINALLVSLGAAMIIACVIVLAGLRPQTRN
jgi:hydroxylaminobenzene mutase